MRQKTIISVILLVLFFSCLNAKSVNQFDKEINSKNKDLKELQKSLNEKQAEKERCLLDEKCIKRELNAIEQDLSKLQRKSEAIRKEMRKAEKNLTLAEKDLKSANYEKNQWHGAMNYEAAQLYKSQYGETKFYTDSFEEKLRLSALQKKKTYLTNAQQRELNSKLALDKWQSAKNKLLDLKARQEQNIQEQEKTKGKKQELLKTATGKRIVAEADLKKLAESAKALENLVLGLKKEKEKTRQEELAARKAPEKRKELPWPVSGKIVANFGKNRNPEYDTVVISNGIKILGAPGTEIKPVDRGEVLFTGEFRSYGQMIIIDHGGSFYSIYGQLGEISAEEGQKVKTTDTIGKLSAKKEPILYFEVRYNGKPEDPLAWLKPK
jgi:septal ring factor EnvC (AmiA/AmiB activator)